MTRTGDGTMVSCEPKAACSGNVWCDSGAGFNCACQETGHMECASVAIGGGGSGGALAQDEASNGCEEQAPCKATNVRCGSRFGGVTKICACEADTLRYTCAAKGGVE